MVHFELEFSDEDKYIRVVRGGSWLNVRGNARCAARFRVYPLGRDEDIGFRCVRTKNS